MTPELKTQIATAIADRAYYHGEWREGLDNPEGDDFGTTVKWSRGYHKPWVDVVYVFYGPDGDIETTELEREEIEILANDMIEVI